MKRILVLGITIILLCGCNKKSEIAESNQIESCPNCVFAYYNEVKTFKQDNNYGLDTLTEYTKDYTTLKDNNGNQRRVFLGHVLDKDNKIIKAYVCGIYNDKPFCLEGGTDNSKYNANKKILNEIFNNCSEYKTQNLKTQCIVENEYLADADYYGRVNIIDYNLIIENKGAASCLVSSTMSCN